MSPSRTRCKRRSGSRTWEGDALLLASQRDKILTSAAFLIGFLTPLLPVQYAALWGLVPLLALEADSRQSSFFVSFVFYLALSCGIVPGSCVFFRDGSLIRALCLWCSSAFGLALPYALLYPVRSSYQTSKAVRLVIAILASAVPPLGLIGWGSSLVAAGLFFPSTGWIGLALLLLLYGLAATWRYVRLVLFVTALALTPILPIMEAIPSANWAGIDTAFGRLASGSADFEEQYQREREVFADLLRKKRNGEFGADILLLPETLIGRMNPTTQKRWRDFLHHLDDKKVFIAGAEIPKGWKYDNVMVAFNAPTAHSGEVIKEQTAIQRCPVPFSMYRPFNPWGANADVFSRGESSMMYFAGEKAGFLICYEQFLAWPMLSMMSLKPNLLAAPANFWWCRDTTLPAVRERTLKLLCALFGVPLVSAVNI